MESSGLHQIVDLFLSDGIQPPTSAGAWLLQNAIIEGWRERVTRLVELGVSISSQLHTPFSAIKDLPWVKESLIYGKLEQSPKISNPTLALQPDIITSSVFYKFESQKQPTRVELDGTGISVFELKRDIIIKCGLGDGAGFDLAIYDEDGKKVIPNETQHCINDARNCQNTMTISLLYPVPQQSSLVDCRPLRETMDEPPGI
jgi:hypothetical protein